MAGDEAAGQDSFVFPMPSESRIDTLLLGCTHYPLLGDVIRGVVGEGIAVIDSASATASALASLLEIHSLGAPAGRKASHVFLTTGPGEAFREATARIFGRAFEAVESIGVGPPVVPAGAGAGA
jgi:glutamate racemase